MVYVFRYVVDSLVLSFIVFLVSSVSAAVFEVKNKLSVSILKQM